MPLTLASKAVGLAIATVMALTGCTAGSASAGKNAAEPATDSADQAVVVYASVDGDTFEAAIDGEQKTIRLLNVDTPETKDPKSPSNAWARRQRRLLRSSCQSVPRSGWNWTRNPRINTAGLSPAYSTQMENWSTLRSHGWALEFLSVRTQQEVLIRRSSRPSRMLGSRCRSTILLTFLAYRPNKLSWHLRLLKRSLRRRWLTLLPRPRREPCRAGRRTGHGSRAEGRGERQEPRPVGRLQGRLN